MNQQFLKGALLLSLSVFATKLLGIVYLVPFKNLVGDEGMSLYGYAYTLYGLFLSLSTLGIPVGLAKFISKYQANGQSEIVHHIFKMGLVLMAGLGVFGFCGLWFFAPHYVQTILTNEPELLTQAADIVQMIRLIGTSLLIIPVMALFRGFFQGHRTMTPTSVSQLLEQFVRVFVILIGSFVIVRVFGGTYQQAVGLSVLAAFFGGLVSLLYLISYGVKHHHQFFTPTSSEKQSNLPKTSSLLIELIQCSVPFALLGLATNLFQNIDTWDFHRLLTEAHVPFDLQKTYYGMYIMELAKIVMIPVSFSIAFSQPLVPELTRAFELKDHDQVNKTLALALRLTLFITLPAMVGMSLLAQPIFIVFYQSTPELNQLGGELFQTGCWLGLFFSLYSITSAMLQGLNLQNRGIGYLIVALGLKYIMNQWLVPLLGVQGFVYSTFIAYALWLGLSYATIKRTTQLSVRALIKENLPSLGWSLIMGVVVYLVLLFIPKEWVYAHRSASLLTCCFISLIGILIYGAGHWRSGTLQPFLQRLRRSK